MKKRRCVVCKKKLGVFEGGVCMECGLRSASKKMFDYDERERQESRRDS